MNQNTNLANEFGWTVTLLALFVGTAFFSYETMHQSVTEELKRAETLLRTMKILSGHDLPWRR